MSSAALMSTKDLYFLLLYFFVVCLLLQITEFAFFLSGLVAHGQVDVAYSRSSALFRGHIEHENCTEFYVMSKNFSL